MQENRNVIYVFFFGNCKSIEVLSRRAWIRVVLSRLSMNHSDPLSTYRRTDKSLKSSTGHVTCDGIMETTWVKCRKLVKIVKKKNRVEVILCSFLLALIPMCYCVNVFHILPRIHQLRSARYFIHAIPLTFVAFNLLANFVAVVLIDSSVVGRLVILPEHTSKGIATRGPRA